MKNILLVALVAASTISAAPVFADGLGAHSLYRTYNGDFGACVNDKGIPACIADWVQGQ